MNKVVDVAWHLILPAFSMAFLNLPLIARLTRTNTVEALEQDYIVTARAKGLREHQVILHALRNALLPVVTILAITLGRTMSGSILVETIFSWPGIGLLLVNAISQRDYPIVLGLFIFISVTVIVANLLADVVYAWLDPRIHYR
jgi:peptide/nickel transport system permease protein